MKWNKSLKGCPFVSAGRLSFILSEPIKDDYTWLVFSYKFGKATQVGTVQYLHQSKLFALGQEFKLTKTLTKHFSKEEKELLKIVRNYIKTRPIIKRSEIKWRK